MTKRDVTRADLVTDVQGEEEHQHASGRVAAVMPGPVVVDVFKEGRVEDLDLGADTDTHANHSCRLFKRSQPIGKRLCRVTVFNTLQDSGKDYKRRAANEYLHISNPSPRGGQTQTDRTLLNLYFWAGSRAHSSRSEQLRIFSKVLTWICSLFFRD